MAQKRTRIGHRFFIVFATIIIINGGGLIFTLVNLNKIADHISSIYSVRLKSVDYLIEADRDAYQSAIEFARSFSPAVFNNPEKLTANMDTMNENRLQVLERFSTFKKIYLEEGAGKETEEFGTFDAEYKKVEKYSAEIEGLLKNGEIDAAELLYELEYNNAFGVMRDAMDQLTMKSLAQAEAEYNSSMAQSAHIRIVSLLILAITTFLSVFFAIFLTKNTLGPIKQLLRAISALANGEGDLTQRVDVAANDEFGELGDTFNVFLQSTHDMIVNIKMNSEMLVEAVKEISDGNQNLSQRTSEQASSLEEIASTIEETSATINQNADNSQRVSKLSEDTAKIAMEGGRIMSDAVSAINEINDSSKKIAEIITVINEISFQTNLLALNAAVEAARAGEQGRGFAVVAGEVRNLAQRSGNAAKEITELINDSLSKVNNGTSLANRSGESLQEIIASVENVTKLITDIAASSEEQKQGTSQINTAIAELDSMTQQNASLVEEIASASEAMSNQSLGLLGTVEKFKTDNVVVGNFGAEQAVSRHVSTTQTKIKKTNSTGQPQEDEKGPDDIEKILTENGFEAF